MPGRSWTSRRRKFTTASSGESRRSRRLFAPAARGTSTGISGSCLEPSSWHYCCSERVKDDRRETAWARAPRDDPARAARAARHRHDPEAQGPAPVPAGCRDPSAVPRPRQAPPQGHGASGHGLGLLPVDSGARPSSHDRRGGARSGRAGGAPCLSVGRRVDASRAARARPLSRGGRCARRRRRIRRHGGLTGDDSRTARRTGVDDGRILDRGSRRDDRARHPRSAPRDVLDPRLARSGPPRLCCYARAATRRDRPYSRGQPRHSPRANDAARRHAARALRAGARLHGACIAHATDRDARLRGSPLLPSRTGGRRERHRPPARSWRVRREGPCARDLSRARRVVLRQASVLPASAVPCHRLRVRPCGARAEDTMSAAETVHTIIDDLGALLLFTMILIVIASQISRAIYAVAAQSLFIAIAGGVLAMFTGNVDLWVIAGVTLAVKAIMLPWVLHWVVRRMNVRREVEPVIPDAATIVLAVAVVVMSFDLSTSLGTVRQAITGNALPVGIALTVLGVLVMATRKTALTQMVGLFASENGIFFTAMAVTQGMPLIIEIGVTLDVILAALVMTILVLRVRSTVDADIADLDRLRG